MSTSRPHILLVDDDEAIRTNLAAYLERGGFRVSVAPEGRTALTMLAAEPPDLAVLDVLMPFVDGREVLRTIRRSGSALPVILLTAVGESDERAAALEEGADDYLNKPFDPQELAARIRAILRRAVAGLPSLATSPRLRSGRLHLDRTARRAHLDGEEVTLTPKAFSLLEYLLSHPDEVITRERLLSAVWGYDFPVASRAVDNRVAELRRVLGEGSIDTVQGAGYRFSGQVERA